MPDVIGTLKTPRLAAAPGSPVVGQMYYDTGTNLLNYWNGTAWVSSGGSGASDPLKVDKDSVVVAATRIVASKLLAGDAQPAFRITGDGKLAWGPGGATAPDVNLYRSVAQTLKTDGTLSAGLNLVSQNNVYLDQGNVGAALIFGSAFDTTLYRKSADNLQTDDSLWVGGGLIVDAAGASQKIYFGSAVDTTLFRFAAGELKTDGRFRSGQAASAGVAFSANNLAANGFLIAGRSSTDTNDRFVVQADGKLLWGPGNVAQDVTLSRQNSGALVVNRGLHIDADTVGYGLSFGNEDVYIYRSGANALTLTGSAAANLTATGNLGAGAGVYAGYGTGYSFNGGPNNIRIYGIISGGFTLPGSSTTCAVALRIDIDGTSYRIPIYS